MKPHPDLDHHSALLIHQPLTSAGEPKEIIKSTSVTVAEELISKAGGIFLGERHLKELGVIDEDVTVPPVPEKFSRAFLNADHPVRAENIAAHIILGFDPETNEWYNFEKSIVPGSLGPYGNRLSWEQQDKLLLDNDGKPKTVQGMEYTSPTDYRPIKRVLDYVIMLYLRNGVAIDGLPLYGVYGRTADTEHADRACCVLLGYSHRYGARFDKAYFGVGAHKNVWLLAGWKKKLIADPWFIAPLRS